MRVVAMMNGITDGLIRRDIRRFVCGDESGFIYRRAKRTLAPVFFLRMGNIPVFTVSLIPV